jgi:2-polyprenyl-3-methyl-5-hydroxy-6-metoxy-1,4-benzoquinol methylase
MEVEKIFESDRIRQRLAAEGKLEQLSATYSGSLPDLPSMNNPEKWDFLAFNCSRMVAGEINPQSKARLSTVAKLVDPALRTLDFGVGPGDVLDVLIQKYPQIDYTGIDIANNFIERLRGRYPDKKFFCRDIAEVETGSFDQLLALEVLEHIDVPNLKSVQAELWRILKPGGQLIISVPIYEKLEDFTLRCSRCGNLENLSGHVRSFTPALIKAELELGGFEIADFKYVWPASSSLPKKIAKRLLRIITGEQPVTIVVKARKTGHKSSFPDYRKNDRKEEPAKQGGMR